MMPIEWREEAPLASDPLKLKGTDVGRGFVIFLGSMFAFPYTTPLLNYQNLFSKLRINAPALVAVWGIRTAILVYLVGEFISIFLCSWYTLVLSQVKLLTVTFTTKQGPIPLILCYNLSMALIGLEATTQHFDQPVMMPEEFYKSGMSFTELTLRSIQVSYCSHHMFISYAHIICSYYAHLVLVRAWHGTTLRTMACDCSRSRVPPLHPYLG